MEPDTNLRIRQARCGKTFERLSGALVIHAAPQPRGSPLRSLTANGRVHILGTDWFSTAWQPPEADIEVVKGTDLSPFKIQAVKVK